MTAPALPQDQTPGDEPAVADTSAAEGLYAGYEQQREADGVAPPPPVKPYFQTMLDAANHPFANTWRELKTVGRSVGLGLARLGEVAATGISHIGGQTPEEKASLAEAAERHNAFYKHGADDHVAEFGGTAVQIAGTAVAAAAVGIPVTSVALTGAAIEAFAFDPYKHGATEMLRDWARTQHGTNIEAAALALEDLSVHPEDSYAVAVSKRALAGASFGIAGEWGIRGLLIPGFKLLQRGSTALRTLRSSTASTAEKAAAEVATAEVNEGLTAMRDGTHTPADRRVVARPNGDGTWSPQMVNREGGDVTKLTYAAIDEELDKITRKRAATTALEARGLGSPERTAEEGAMASRRVALEDEIARREAAGETIPLREEAAHQNPRMDRAEAEAQASSMDEVLRGEEMRGSGQMWSAEDVATHEDLVQRIRAAKSPEAAMEELQITDPFNLDTMRDVGSFRDQQRALVAQFGEEIRALRQRVPVSNTMLLAEDFARTIGLHEWANNLRYLSSEDGLTESVKMVLNSRAMEQAGERLGQLYSWRASRPHDLAALTETRRMGAIWYDLSMEVAGAHSEWGRTGQIMQELQSGEARRVRFVNDVKMRSQGKTAVQTARSELAKAPAAAEQVPTSTVDVMKKVKELGLEDEVRAEAAMRSGSAADVENAARTVLKDRLDAKSLKTLDTDAVNASDFSLARARAHAEKVQEALDAIGSDYPRFELDPEGAVERARGIREAAEAQRADPLAPPTAGEKAAVAADKAKRQPPANPIEQLSKWLDGADAELDKVRTRAAQNEVSRDVAARQKAGTAFDENLRQGETPVDAAKRVGKEAERKAKAFEKSEGMKLFGDMEDAELDAWARLFQRSGGKVRNVQAVLKTLKEKTEAVVARELAKTTPQKIHDGIQTTFIANLISGIKTAESIATSGAAMNAFRAAGKVLAGGATGDVALLEEGAAQFYAIARYAKENTASAAAAFSEARGVMDGAPRVYMQGGVIKTGIQLPGRIAGTLDEFTRVTAYRADEFAQAFRQARAEGMSVDAAVARAEGDVKFSFKDGIALNDAARQRAGIPTLSDALGPTTAAGHFAAGLNELPLGKLIVPFMRPSVNTFRFVAENTPGLNVFNANARKIMAEGGSEAAQLHARSVIVGSMMALTVSEFLNGNVTGDGPSDPALRKLWEEDHQQYSVKIGGQWVSYRRLEPFASWISLMADATETYLEVDEDGNSGNVMYAVFSAMLKNSYNKSWTQGLSEKLTAWQRADRSSLARVAGGVVEGLMVPQAVQQANDDPYYREARGILDNLRANTPGLSKSLSPRYNWDGNAELRQHVLWNQLSMFPMKSAKPSFVANELVKNNIKISTFPARQFKNQIDLLDPQYEKNGVLPYARFMDLLRLKDIRGQMERLMKSPAWDKMSPGTSTYPGGEREQEIRRIKDIAEQDAIEKVLSEWRGTTLPARWDAVKYELPAVAKYDGPDREATLRKKVGVQAPSRR